MKVLALRRLPVLLIWLLLSFAVASGATTGDVPDAKTIWAHVREAAGTPLATETRVTAFTANGMTGSEVYRVSGDDWRDVVHHGPFEYADGRFQGQRWRQNENGETIYEQPEAGKAVADPTTVTVQHVSQPFDAYVISDLNLRGHGTKDYIDPTTWRIVRRDWVAATETTTAVYDDFRATAGYVRAWHWAIRDGHPEDDEEYRISSDDAAPVDPTALAIPPSRRNLVEFPAGKSVVALPVRLSYGKFIVRVNVGGRGLDFILDSGASGIVMDEDVARQLGLKLYAPESNAANAGRYTSETTIVPEMLVGNLTMRDVVVDTAPHFDDDVPGEYKAVGLLGFDFIGSLALKLDYQNGTVTAYDDDAFTPPQDPLTNALDVRLGDGQPMTDVTVNGALGERFLVDTGGAATVLIFDYFARRHPGTLGQRSEADSYFLGVGGTFDVQAYTLPDVLLGNVHFQNFVAYAVASKGAYEVDQDGLIGSDFLSLFDVYLDYEDSRIYLVPTNSTRRMMGKVK